MTVWSPSLSGEAAGGDVAGGGAVGGGAADGGADGGAADGGADGSTMAVGRLGVCVALHARICASAMIRIRTPQPYYRRPEARGLTPS